MESPDVSALFLGDLGEEAQRALMRDSPVGRVDVVKVAHHGSRDQSPALYRRLAAQLALVSVGKDNSYGHPTTQTLTMLRELGARVSRTDDSGLLLVSAREGHVSVWTER
jgi:competence protein ComEC